MGTKSELNIGNMTVGQALMPSTQRSSVDIKARPQNPWVFKTLSASGWDFEGNPVLVVVTLEVVKEEGTGKLRGSNVIFDFVDPKKPSNRVAVMTDSAIEIFDEIKAAYTVERLADDKK